MTQLNDTFADVPLETEPTENVVHMWTPFNLSIDKNYSYVKNSMWFNIWSNFLRWLVCSIFPIYNRIMFGFKVIGKENLNSIHGGIISVSNHIHLLDCTMAGSTLWPRKVYFPTLKSNLEIPLIRFLVRGLCGIPIPEGKNDLNRFRAAIKEILDSGDIIHLYPEGILYPYYKDGVRSFRRGAFTFAYDNNVPILPMVYTYRKVTGKIARFFHRKPYISLYILKPLYPNINNDRREEIKSLKECCRKAMKEAYEQHNELKN